MSSLVIKLIAVVTMTVDHIGAIFQTHRWDFADLAFSMRAVGRIAFPLFCFLIAEGMRKTRSRIIYLKMLAVFALISVMPFSLFRSVAVYGPSARGDFYNFSVHNVLFTLFFGGLSIALFDLVRNRLKVWLKGIPGFIIALAAPALCAVAVYFIGSDYGPDGVIMIFLIYLLTGMYDIGILKAVPKRARQYISVAPMFVWASITYGRGLIPGSITVFAVFAAIAPLLALLYDGSPGNMKARSTLKIWFYAYYPAHMMVIYMWSLFVRPGF
jgi:hypothetical protein